MAKKIRVGFVPVDGDVKDVYIEEVDGSFLEPIRELIGCRCVEAFSPMYGDTPLLWIDDEGIYTQVPNRAVYANDRMVEQQYLSSLTGKPVKKGELHTILFGNIVAACYEYDEEGEDYPRDITDEELKQLKEDFKEIESGLTEALKIRYGLI